jgi:hypothetical protein
VRLNRALQRLPKRLRILLLVVCVVHSAVSLVQSTGPWLPSLLRSGGSRCCRVDLGGCSVGFGSFDHCSRPDELASSLWLARIDQREGNSLNSLSS